MITHPPLRMGRIGYLNVLPIYHPLETGIIAHEYEIISAPPAVLNTMMARGELHISSASCFEYAQHPDRYYLIDDLSIGSRGPVMSVLLLSRRPVKELGGHTISITGETATSVALLRLLMQERYGLHVLYQTDNITQRLHEGPAPEAFLAIGDEALRLRHHADYPHRVDLAEAWREWTGLPFIFGLWVVDKKAADTGMFRHNPADLLHRARDWGLTHMDVILEVTAHGCPLNRDELRSYYQDGLLYTLRHEEIKGLTRFFTMLEAAQLIKRAPALKFYVF